jgi:hypothetical protein
MRRHGLPFLNGKVEELKNRKTSDAGSQSSRISEDQGVTDEVEQIQNLISHFSGHGGAERLARILTANDQALRVARGPGARMPCVCWHFSTLLVGTLREQGVSARARCGFGTSFSNPGRFEDHWVAEYWNASQKRWVLVDAQLDSVQRQALKRDFDPLDVPHDRFIIAGGRVIWEIPG